MLAPQTIHLPNGQKLSVAPVFAGVAFKSTDLSAGSRSAFPPGWTIVINEEDDDAGADADGANDNEDGNPQSQLDGAEQQRRHDQAGKTRTPPESGSPRHSIHRYKRPTLQNDHLFISSISNPSSADFRPATSPTRQIAMMLWATLWWYFHQPEPDPHLTTRASAKTPPAGRPKGEWRININKEGIFKGKSLLLKLLRMGLITTDESSVGDVAGERELLPPRLFVTRRSFWQIDGRIFLFTLAPAVQQQPQASSTPSASPRSSRASSPTRIDSFDSRPPTPSLSSLATTPAPFASGSHLPTYFPPHPARYTMTHGVRHPVRPPAYRQGETIYSRYIPSVGQYLSFRVASLAGTAPAHIGPWTPAAALQSMASAGIYKGGPARPTLSDALVPTMGSMGLGPSDVDLLHSWMNLPRVARSWAEDGPRAHQEAFLRAALRSKHSLPVIGCWDGRPFGYFEIYWVKEDRLGQYLGAGAGGRAHVGDWDRGLHLLVGEDEFRGPHRVKVWLSALVHHCWLSDMRTDCIMLEPRVDNTKLAKYLQEAGFFKEREIALPHKQSNLFKVYRDTWEKPEL